MHFTVTLHNTSESTVRPYPCPVYTEGTYSDIAHSYVYTLDCDTTRAIQPKFE